MMNLFSNIIIIVESYIMISIVELFFPSKNKWLKGIGITILLIYSNILDTGTHPYFITIYVITIFIYSLIALQKGNVFAKFFYSLCATLAVSACTVLIMGILSIYDYSAHEILSREGYHYIFNVGVSRIVLVCLYITFKKIMKTYEFTKKQWLLLCGSSLILFASLVDIFMIFVKSEDMMIYCGIAMLLLVSLYIIFCIYFLIISRKNVELLHKNMKLKMLEANQEYSQRILDAYEGNRKLKHDLSHHLTAIYGKLEDNDIDGIRIYIERLSDKMDKIQIINTDNTTLNNLINYRMLEMENLNIIFRHQISESLSFVDDIDLAIVIGNLLSNAIEAQQYVERNRFIDIAIFNKNGLPTIKVSNSCNMAKISMKENNLVTNKNNHYLHGFGIENIKSIVEKYYGVIQIKVEENVFKVVIVLSK